MKRPIGWMPIARHEMAVLAWLLMCAAAGHGQGQTTSSGFGSSSGSTGFTSTISTSSAPTLISGTIGNQATISANATGGPASSGAISSVSSGVSTSNIFSATYNNPQAGGIATTTQGGGKFGGPLFGNLTTQASTSGTVSVSIFGSSLGGSGATAGVGLGASQSYGAVAVRTTEFSSPANPANRLQAELRNILNRSTALSSARQIDVVVVGDAVLLRGKVADERERRLAEGLIWLTPGVGEVRNELSMR